MAIYSAGRRRTMVILLLSSILLITLDLRGNAVFNAARAGFGYALRPFEIAGEVITRPVSRVWDGMTRVDDLERENERLQQQIDTQRSDQITAQAALQENFELRAALNLESLAAFERKTCSVIGSSPTNFAQRVEIDCGSLDSLRVGMPVVNDAGLVGKITNVSPEVSTVMLVTDPLYHVPVKVIAEVDPTPSTTTPATVPSGLPVDDVTTTTSTTTTTTTLAPDDEGAASAEADSDGEGPGSETATTPPPPPPRPRSHRSRSRARPACSTATAANACRGSASSPTPRSSAASPRATPCSPPAAATAWRRPTSRSVAWPT